MLEVRNNLLRGSAPLELRLTGYLRLWNGLVEIEIGAEWMPGPRMISRGLCHGSAPLRFAVKASPIQIPIWFATTLPKGHETLRSLDLRYVKLTTLKIGKCEIHDQSQVVID